MLRDWSTLRSPPPLDLARIAGHDERPEPPSADLLILDHVAHAATDWRSRYRRWRSRALATYRACRSGSALMASHLARSKRRCAEGWAARYRRAASRFRSRAVVFARYRSRPRAASCARWQARHRCIPRFRSQNSSVSGQKHARPRLTQTSQRYSQPVSSRQRTGGALRTLMPRHQRRAPLARPR